MIQYKLLNGDVVDVEPNDCGCIHHPGIPHWLHMDRLTRTLNSRLYNPDKPSRSAFFAFAKEEAARLRIKAHEMEKRGISAIIGDDPRIDDPILEIVTNPTYKRHIRSIGGCPVIIQSIWDDSRGRFARIGLPHPEYSPRYETVLFPPEAAPDFTHLSIPYPYQMPDATFRDFILEHAAEVRQFVNDLEEYDGLLVVMGYPSVLEAAE